MKILIIGSGGREHALAWKLRQSPLVERIWCAPGNGGTAQVATNVAIPDDDLDAIVNFARNEGVDLVVPGPEKPLALGLADRLAEAGINCFGPNAFAARLEASKSFAKQVMLETGVPTAHFAVFKDIDRARAFVEEKGAPLVVKADGLAAGKGVVVCESKERALWALDEIMGRHRFGAAGETVVIEEMLVGEEVSFLAFCDGEHVAWMPTCQDHKPIGEGDTGDNTGGMGAFSPAHILAEQAAPWVSEKVITPITRYMKAQGHPFVGILYAGIIITDEGPKVLEYNVRFGDPECQPLMMRLTSDLAATMQACVNGKLPQAMPTWSDMTAVCVVMAAMGYPGDYPKGMVIEGLEDADEQPQVKVFQAGTAQDHDGTITATGGRVLGVTALGSDLMTASKLAYRAVEMIRFENSYVRHDIGAKGLKWEPKV